MHKNNLAPCSDSWMIQRPLGVRGCETVRMLCEKEFSFLEGEVSEGEMRKGRNDRERRRKEIEQYEV